MRGAAGIGLGTTIKYLRCPTSGAAGNGLGTTIKYFVNQKRGRGQQLGQGPLHKILARYLLTPPLWCSGFCSKLRAPHRGTSLGSCVCVGGARFLAVFITLEYMLV
jgi:hypothetical protein